MFFLRARFKFFFENFFFYTLQNSKEFFMFFRMVVLSRCKNFRILRKPEMKFFGILPITPVCVGVMTNKLYWHILRRTGLLLEAKKYQNRVVEILVLSEPAGKTRFGPVLDVKRRSEFNATCFRGVTGTYITKKYVFLENIWKNLHFFK